MKIRKSPLVSIIIATKNEAEHLPHLLQSITHQTYSHIETIVVDNHSTDSTKTIACIHTNLVYTHGTERSRQRNFGAQKARGKYLLFLDADMVLTPNVIQECVVAAAKLKTSGVIIPETVEITSFFTRVKRLEKELYFDESIIEAARFFVGKSFLKISGYNEKLIAGEDWDLSQRIARIGKINRINEYIYHNEVSLIGELRKKWYYAIHISAYQKLHPEEFKLQSNYKRLALMWRKKRLLIQSPLESVALIILKSCELLIYIFNRKILSLQK